jgi:hypothetical protein
MSGGGPGRTAVLSLVRQITLSAMLTSEDAGQLRARSRSYPLSESDVAGVERLGQIVARWLDEFAVACADCEAVVGCDKRCVAECGCQRRVGRVNKPQVVASLRGVTPNPGAAAARL